MTKVLIVGGGIAGLCAAAALRRTGVEVDLVEKNPVWTVYGVGIIQQFNVVRAMAGIGLLDEYLDVSFGFDHTQVCDAEGRLLADLPNGRLAGPEYPANIGVSRRALHDVLLRAAETRGAVVRQGVTVLTLDQSADHVDVAFSDGVTARYDLVVGADGLYSQIRSMLWGDAYPAQFAGQGGWRCNFPLMPDLDCIRIFMGTGNNAGLVPISKDEMYLFCTSTEPGNPRMAEDRLHALFRDRLAGFGGLIAEYRDQMNDPGQIVYKPFETVFVPGSWHKGRVLLIGDAAHASTPHLAQGAGMAIEDAVVLAEQLAKDIPLEGQLAGFMERRYERAKLIAETSLQLCQWEIDQVRVDLPAVIHRINDKVAEPI